MEASTSIDVGIIGAGIIGLSIARSLKRSHPEWEIAVFDKMPFVGEHASGRNSGVLHAGLYYSPDSLKKRFCREGLKLWPEFAKDIGVDILPCGKYITAQNSEVERLETLFERARLNGVCLRWATDEELLSFEPFVKADRAFFSPDTSVIDPSEVMSKLAQRVESLGVHLLFQHELISVSKDTDGYRLQFSEYDVACRYMINAAGAGAVGIRRKLGLDDLQDNWVKGAYLKTFKPFYKDALLYTLPLEDLKGLGVHTCIDFDGQVKFGPNAIDTQKISYSLTEDEVLTLREEVLSKFRISGSELHLDFAGIRSKIIYKDKVYTDFWIEEAIPFYIELCGIESPGFTSAPSIAEYVTQRVSSFVHSK